ncbi:trna modification gtpase : tRNA modification GTPase MnmE OS=Planctomyces brasiliensis (strain ATCC 49424 / DSM 5305 / JCM 21570 / NBRC 103401 / IFAM 1448) GN=mnmE PE=3 SV=1: TrmE_N: TrmE_N: MMR_HSR1: GTPase_Cys_C [Gemmata massiliana]|uniref:tRNA modification GTPase MnmE n=1 Tax=Gemmata massiliana TaxID=1210884 RepID=A0A6P2DME7_9BACT|nr:tRNA modification GTPase [Gemmata massiliana]VTS03870.1 trna modification gtpase : tRNA modification GTPase MnmE OS=Planctomyces brasiliensis (strain ATCC 49424 / DSM 5305 / JCM 21570 / NBRC 103401 / IFAM 1448) GN=mnmE PE=3 SV=1: TrmE_N: TrmE_N: MMR_HSR1: GTPase_Cys_C [Gemmata massiliana]
MSLTATTAPHPDDTIVAVSSANGSAARAIVRVSGPGTRTVIRAVFAAEPIPPSPLPEGKGERARETSETNASFTERGNSVSPFPSGRGAGGVGFPPRRVVPGFLRLSGVHSPLPASLYFFAGPKSYTGQDLAELHTVGSPPLVERLVADLLAAGARPARPGEFTMRAFLAGKKDLPQAEAVQAVIEAGTDADLTTALAQLAGGVSQPLNVLRDDLLNLLADIEAALDFADEDIEFVGRAELLARVQRAIDLLETVQKQLDDRTVSGRPVRVALVGLPNAGKSSLFNALTGAVALVSPTPGTTRDYLTQLVTVGGVIIELIDTAGWQGASDTIEEQAQRLGSEQTTRADVIVWCDERGAFDITDERRLLATGANVLKVRTKSDLLPESRSKNTNAVSVSVLAFGGLNNLHSALSDTVTSLTRPALAPSQSRCRHHVLACLEHLREAHALAANNDTPELLALALRGAIEPLGEMTGAVYTNDLLDRIFSRFCIGK